MPLPTTVAAVLAASLALAACSDGGPGGEGGADSGGPEVDASDAPMTDVPAPDCTSDFECVGVAGIETCRTPRCVEGECVAESRPDQTPCDDYDRCTEDTVCLAGECAGGAVVDCDDGEACTEDACDSKTGCSHAVPSPAPGCDDGDPCTLGDACEADGSCAGAPDPRCGCAGDEDCAVWDDEDLCNGVQRCVEGICQLDPGTVVTCPPASGPCLVRSCDPSTGMCPESVAPDGSSCDDQNACTSADRCKAGACVGDPGGCACTQDEQCKAFQQTGYDLCQGPLFCVEGVCQPRADEAIVCEQPADPCLVAICSPATGLCGLSLAPQGTPCEGSDPCAPPGTCVLGACQSPPPSCDDDNPCTLDECVIGEGCDHLPTPGQCEDGDPCTVGDTCVGGDCSGGETKLCEDGNPCTADLCDPEAGGCVFPPAADGTSCEDGSACTTDGTCEGGVCVGLGPVQCPQGQACETWTCLPELGCTPSVLPDGAPCDDGDPCTQEGECAGGECEALPAVCSDGNPCTLDGCDSAGGGCFHDPLPDGQTCEPDNPCLVGGSCQSGLCTGGSPISCDMGPCELRECKTASGVCEVVAVLDSGEPCGDDGPCLEVGGCVAGECVGAGPVDCDDDDACTVDACDEVSGACSHAPLECPLVEDPCVDSGCDPAAGCGTAPAPICEEGLVLLATSFPCGGGEGWLFSIIDGVVGFAIDDTPSPPKAYDGACSLNLNDGISYASGEASTHARALSPPLTLGPPGEALDPAGVLVVRFYEWVDLDEPADSDRRWVRLLDEAGVVLGEQELDKGPPTGWALRQISWPLAELDPAALEAPTWHLELELDTYDAFDNDGAGWFVDRLIVIAL